ncbi:MAG: hypothetical protein AUH30_19255 [Candidatus Rokubacteria bacterium 13_1_40CM_68_15]|nr:MAG: hypothetical protein AUH30_19255 [Candidatus Rokubacteria bacterium 13_1_40CM_68_15]
MKSVLDRLRDEDREALLALTPTQRVTVALSLGERDLEAFRRASGLSRAEAARVLERQKQHGRRVSGCLAALIG